MADEPTLSHASHDTLHLELRFDLTLHRGGPMPSWRAELAGPRGGQRLLFESLPDLMRYLARLDLQAPPARGIQ